MGYGCGIDEGLISVYATLLVAENSLPLEEIPEEDGAPPRLTRSGFQHEKGNLIRLNA